MTRTYHKLSIACAKRQAEWDPNSKLDISFRAAEHAGEVGEVFEEVLTQALAALQHGAAAGKAINIAKKLSREEKELPGSRATVQDLGNELADDVITAYLLAFHYSIDLDAYIENKFNAVSEKRGFKTRLKLGY